MAVVESPPSGGNGQIHVGFVTFRDVGDQRARRRVVDGGMSCPVPPAPAFRRSAFLVCGRGNRSHGAVWDQARSCPFGFLLGLTPAAHTDEYRCSQMDTT